MRVIGGKLRGKLIHNPTDKTTRPLKDMVRESIFNILEHSKNEKIKFKNDVVLDLFSGSVYLDPPFKDKNINKLLRKILDLKIAHKSTLIVIHRNKKFKENFIEDFKVLREKKYGLSKIIFGKLLF